VRLVSLLPSATEIVCALGLDDQLVGRSHECDYPPEVKRLPVCTSSKLDLASDSHQIDRQVKVLLQRALSLYHIDTATLKALQPDVILTQSQCEVCAVTSNDLEEALGDWIGSRPLILSLAPTRLAEVWNNIREVAERLDVPNRGTALAGRLEGRVEAIAAKARAAASLPSVACIEWLDPLMAAGNWVPELVEGAGGLNLFGEPGQHAPWLNWEAVQEHDPEILVLMPCGFDIARTCREMDALTRRPDWSKLRAVRPGCVFLTDGNQYFNRPGPRLVESLEILAELIHPKLFDFGHEGRGWRRLTWAVANRLPSGKPEG
jgi:iron complex transport system substrate-binding protein